MFGIRLTQHSRMRDALALFLLGVGALVLWRRRGVASLRGRAHTAMYPLLWRVREMLMVHLESELATLGEEAFLRRWSCRFITVRDGRVAIRVDERST